MGPAGRTEGRGNGHHSSQSIVEDEFHLVLSENSFVIMSHTHKDLDLHSQLRMESPGGNDSAQSQGLERMDFGVCNHGDQR